jgi:PAS domain S-box-containing protein
MLKQVLSSGETMAILEALSRSQAVIEFEMDGAIIRANENFLGAMGYTLEEVQGKHHRRQAGSRGNRPRVDERADRVAGFDETLVGITGTRRRISR